MGRIATTFMLCATLLLRIHPAAAQTEDDWDLPDSSPAAPAVPSHSAPAERAPTPTTPPSITQPNTAVPGELHVLLPNTVFFAGSFESSLLCQTTSRIRSSWIWQGRCFKAVLSNQPLCRCLCAGSFGVHAECVLRQVVLSSVRFNGDASAQFPEDTFGSSVAPVPHVAAGDQGIPAVQLLCSSLSTSRQSLWRI